MLELCEELQKTENQLERLVGKKQRVDNDSWVWPTAFLIKDTAIDYIDQRLNNARKCIFDKRLNCVRTTLIDRHRELEDRISQQEMKWKVHVEAEIDALINAHIN